jgi:hypothetical protein
MVAKNRDLFRFIWAWSLPQPLSSNASKNRQSEKIRCHLDLLDSFRFKIDQQLEYFESYECFKISRDAQLHRWANSLATERFPIFVHPTLEQPHSQLIYPGLISRLEFVGMEALCWNLVRSLHFDFPSRNFPKHKLKAIRMETANMALCHSKDWETRLRSSEAPPSALQMQSQLRNQLHLLLRQLTIHSNSNPLSLTDNMLALIFSLHALREAQRKVSELTKEKSAQISSQSPPVTSASLPRPPVSKRAQERKFQPPICWKYVEKGNHFGSC